MVSGFLYNKQFSYHATGMPFSTHQAFTASDPLCNLKENVFVHAGITILLTRFTTSCPVPALYSDRYKGVGKSNSIRSFDNPLRETPDKYSNENPVAKNR